jgi:transcriptional regulator with XRE-family HTH domain
MLTDYYPSHGVFIMATDSNSTLGQRIKRMRQERNWSQAELAKQLQVHQKQISGYERGIHIPSTEVLIRMAQEFNCSLDYLAFENREDSARVSISDRDLLTKLEEIEKLPEQDRTTIKAVLETFLVKRRFQMLAAVE